MIDPRQSRSARAWLRVSQEEMAESIGCYKSTLERFEAGRQGLSPELAGKLQHEFERRGLVFTFSRDGGDALGIERRLDMVEIGPSAGRPLGRAVTPKRSALIRRTTLIAFLAGMVLASAAYAEDRTGLHQAFPGQPPDTYVLSGRPAVHDTDPEFTATKGDIDALNKRLDDIEYIVKCIGLHTGAPCLPRH